MYACPSCVNVSVRHLWSGCVTCVKFNATECVVSMYVLVVCEREYVPCVRLYKRVQRDNNKRCPPIEGKKRVKMKKDAALSQSLSSSSFHLKSFIYPRRHSFSPSLLPLPLSFFLSRSLSLSLSFFLSLSLSFYLSFFLSLSLFLSHCFRLLTPDFSYELTKNSILFFFLLF